jgi:hypothetical protein
MVILYLFMLAPILCDDQQYYSSFTVKFNNHTTENKVRQQVILSMWNTIMDAMNQLNPQITYSYSTNLKHLELIDSNSSAVPDVWADFYQYLDADVSNFYTQDAIFYNPSKWILTQPYLYENYIFVKVSRISQLVGMVVKNSTLMILVLVIPWYLVHLNIIGLFLLKLDRQTYYHERIRQALIFLFGPNLENQGYCLLAYRVVIKVLNFIIFAIVLMDSIYMVSAIISKYRITTTYDLINNLAKPCFLEDKAFIAEILQLHREIDYFT